MSPKGYNQLDSALATAPVRRPKAEGIAEEIKRRIVSGFYAPHAYLPSERDLSAELMTSRRSVSAALAKLHQEGFVVQARGRGTRVLPLGEATSRNTIPVACAHWPVFPTQLTRILQGVSRVLARFGYKYEIFMQGAPEGKSMPLRAVAEKFGGLLCLHTFGHQDEICAIEKAKLPVVVAGLEEQIDVTGTWVDHRKTTRTAVNILVGMGHRRIAMLIGAPHRYFFGEAIAGYREGLRAAGIPASDEVLIQCEGSTALDAYLAIKPLIEGQNRPTAIVCGRDYQAYGACRASIEAGLVIGRDMSVFGFDDNSWPQEEPFLTTFREPCEELGAVAAEMLIWRLVNGWQPPERREIEAPLIFRRSVGPVAGVGPADLPREGLRTTRTA